MALIQFVESKRVTAQSGAFLVAGLLTLFSKSTMIGVERFVIPGAPKPSLREELDSMGINQMTIYPDLQSAANYISNKWKNN